MNRFIIAKLKINYWVAGATIAMVLVRIKMMQSDRLTNYTMTGTR